MRSMTSTMLQVAKLKVLGPCYQFMQIVSHIKPVGLSVPNLSGMLDQSQSVQSYDGFLHGFICQSGRLNQHGNRLLHSAHIHCLVKNLGDGASEHLRQSSISNVLQLNSPLFCATTSSTNSAAAVTTIKCCPFLQRQWTGFQ